MKKNSVFAYSWLNFYGWMALSFRDEQYLWKQSQGLSLLLQDALI